MGISKLKVTGINHVVLHVTDLDRSRTFYMEALGFDDRGSVPGMKASFLRCGVQGLDLFAKSHHVTRCSSPTRTAIGLKCCP